MFSLKRFNTQFAILLGQNATRHGIALSAMLLFFTLLHFKFTPNLILTDGNPFDHWLLLTFAGCIGFSLDVFRQLRSRTAGIYYQMTPATAFEKWLAALLYTTVFTIGVLLVSCWLVHGLIITGANLFSSSEYTYQSLEWRLLWDNLKQVFFFQSLFFLGAVLFKKNPFLKTILVIVASIVLFSLIMGLLIKHQLNIDSVSVSIDSRKGNNGLELIEQFEALMKGLIVASWVLPFACWVATWYRIKTIQY